MKETCYFDVTLKWSTRGELQHTNIVSAISSLTQSLTSFQLRTPIRGAFILVNITTSSTNARRLSPQGPPRFGENFIFSLLEPDFDLLADAANPFKHPRPFFEPTFIKKLQAWINA